MFIFFPLLFSHALLVCRKKYSSNSQYLFTQKYVYFNICYTSRNQFTDKLPKDGGRRAHVRYLILYFLIVYFTMGHIKEQ